MGDSAKADRDERLLFIQLVIKSQFTVEAVHIYPRLLNFWLVGILVSYRAVRRFAPVAFNLNEADFMSIISR